jgi:hypothetical protein
MKLATGEKESTFKEQKENIRDKTTDLIKDLLQN